MTAGKYFDTSIGRLYAAAEKEGIVRLSAGSAEAGDYVIGSGSERDPGEITELKELLATELQLLDRAEKQIAEYLEGRRTDFDLPLKTMGTPFQEKVWAALRRIPCGETRTYGEIAAAVGSPKGARAVGMACNRNPVMIITPCHRVVGSTGKLVGFAGGLDMKAQLLELEKELHIAAPGGLC